MASLTHPSFADFFFHSVFANPGSYLLSPIQAIENAIIIQPTRARCVYLTLPPGCVTCPTTPFGHFVLIALHSIYSLSHIQLFFSWPMYADTCMLYAIAQYSIMHILAYLALLYGLTEAVLTFCMVHNAQYNANTPYNYPHAIAWSK